MLKRVSVSTGSFGLIGLVLQGFTFTTTVCVDNDYYWNLKLINIDLAKPKSGS